MWRRNRIGSHENFGPDTWGYTVIAKKLGWNHGAVGRTINVHAHAGFPKAVDVPLDGADPYNEGGRGRPRENSQFPEMYRYPG
jgi:hypothetical protein